VIPVEEAPATFSAFVQSPSGGPAVTNASVTFPGGAEIELTNQFGFFTLFEGYETEGELEAFAPPSSRRYLRLASRSSIVVSSGVRL
jgi:hypothetical protein